MLIVCNQTARFRYWPRNSIVNLKINSWTFVILYVCERGKKKGRKNEKNETNVKHLLPVTNHIRVAVLVISISEWHIMLAKYLKLCERSVITYSSMEKKTYK